MNSPNQTSLTLTQPDDWHIHLRDGAALGRTVNDAAKQFNRAIVMPNLHPPVTSIDQAQSYRQRIISALQKQLAFTPLMTLYLTDNTSAAIVREAARCDFIYAFKWYPAGATTNSDAGVTDVRRIYPALEAMQNEGIVLAVHGEVTLPEIDIFDREARFIDQTLTMVVADFPELKIVFEHISTYQAVDFVRDASDKVAATITAHHLLYNRNEMLVGGIRPHFYCLPILKRSEHQQALIRAATSGNAKFFLGTDSAPHLQQTKETACGCAGVYSAHAAIELYTEAFEQANALDKLEAFASFYGPDFYGLPRNQDNITLKRRPWQVPDKLSMADESLIPLAAGETVNWQLE